MGIAAAVIGAGVIGALLDNPGATQPLTHAGGYVAAGFDLVALVETAPQAQHGARRWGCDVFGDFDEMMRAKAPVVLSFAVPADVRPRLLMRALAYKPKLVIAEKPLAPTVEEAAAISSAYQKAGVPLVVNYTRRFMPFWQEMKSRTAMSATIRYAKGLRHNGTHAIDLCRLLFGECLLATPLTRKSDHWQDDPTVSAHLVFERCQDVFLQGLDERCFTLFEVDIVGPDWRAVVDSDGRRVRRFQVRENVGIPAGRRLIEEAECRTGAEDAMLNLMRHARDVLYGASPLCSGDDAVAAQRIAAEMVG